MDPHTAAEDLLFAAEQTRTRDLSTRLQRDLRRLGATVAFAPWTRTVRTVVSEVALSTADGMPESSVANAASATVAYSDQFRRQHIRIFWNRYRYRQKHIADESGAQQRNDQ